MLGGVVTKDVVAGSVVGGVPAKSLALPGWVEFSEDEILSRWGILCGAFAAHRPDISTDRLARLFALYDPVERTYEKIPNLPHQVEFNKWLFHGLAYFRPEGE